MSSTIAQAPNHFDLNATIKSGFDLANTGIVSYFGYKTTKVTTANLAKAPAGNAALIVIFVGVVIAGAYFILKK